MQNELDELVLKVNNTLPAAMKDLILHTKEEKLISLHHTLGRHIRNSYNLWNVKYYKDCKEMHPDDVSQYVIESLWRILKCP